ncbi:amidohydrolase family protein [Lutibaculum baratangense]|uniref:amidohydrolase family protein n=1 Tax=Lutibaculum baratangense TaxID=1358440 RepID=UPI00190F09CD|nr:amidohydrolase family protein [Lutibaculum baratangense]
MLDLLIVGATLVTGTRGDEIIHDGHLAIEGNRIVSIGRREDIPDGTDAARMLEIPGRLVTAGYVNVHTHAVLSLMRGIAVDMGFAPAYTRGVPHGHDVNEDEAVALARLGALEALSFGSTTMVDSWVHAHATLPAMAELGLRVWSCTRFHDVDFTRVHEGVWVHDPRIGDACIASTIDLLKAHHGGAGGRTNVMLAPHAPDTCSEELLRKVAHLSAETGLNVWTHLSQSRIENDLILKRSGCTPTQLLKRAGLLNDKLIAAHCIFLSEEDIPLIADSGMTVAHVPKGNATGGAMAPTPSLREAGARIALATDNLTQDMTEVMRWALAVARLQTGKVSTEWQPEDVYEMATAAGARALGQEGRIGALAVDALADLVVFDMRKPHLTPLLDPLGTLVHDGCGRDVEHVFVDGRQVVGGGEALLVNAAAIRAEAQAAAEAIWERTAAAHHASLGNRDQV